MSPFAFPLLVIVALGCIPTSLATAQASDPDPGFSQEELQQLAAPTQSSSSEPTKSSAGLRNSLNFLTLLIEGGPLMIPIGLMSLLVVAVTLERFVSLRRGMLLPGSLKREIRNAGNHPPAASMTVLFSATQHRKSAAGRMLRDVVLKAGRPIPEIESVISEGAQREADYLYGNVRWLSLAAAVTPLIGLLGTVWGMIIAFYNTTQLGAGMNKAEFLAEGIYVALVTTLGGLAVAIPAAIFAHYFEGKITRTLAIIDAQLRNLMPILESLEGKGRFNAASQQFTSAKANNASRTPTDGSQTRVAPPHAARASK
ncbi:MAG: MotA/TolQ/ExbB proton channel family protein [Aureliella sp.]